MLGYLASSQYAYFDVVTHTWMQMEGLVTWVSVLCGLFKAVLPGHRFTNTRHFLFSGKVIQLGAVFFI
jgi:hypothetical protein